MISSRRLTLLTTAALVGVVAGISAQNRLYTFLDPLSWSVAGAGDVNKDGHDDVIVGGAANGGNGIGYARVLSGEDGSILYTFYGDTVLDFFSWSVAGAGDVNKDGYADVVVGAPYGDTPNAGFSGYVRVFSGADGSILYTFLGDSAGDRCGESVAGAGDVNKDGYADIIVSVTGDDTNAMNSGSAKVFSGADGSTLHTIYGDFPSGDFGASVAGVGDVNKDGYADFIVVGNYDNNGGNPGSVRVHSGADGSTLHTFNGDFNGHSFGFSVASAGDANQDGYIDFIVGAIGGNTNGFRSGSARIISGADGSTLREFHGPSAEDWFGCSVAGIGDINKDGYDDVIVGARGDDTNGSSSGSAWVLSPVDGAILYKFDGDSAGDQFGKSVAGAGDINQDDYPDFIVGAIDGNTNGFRSGSARILSGADGSTLREFHGPSAEDWFGCSVAGIGDVNKDGYDDVIVGARGDATNGLWSGSAWVLSPVDGAILHKFDGASAGDQFGDAVAGAGDINQDGYPDFMFAGGGGARVFSGLGCCPSTGLSCTAAPCESCPGMVATTSGGAPTLDNPSFALELLNAPANMNYAVLAIGNNPCYSTGPNYVFCDSIKVPQPLWFLAAMPFTQGAAACTTNVQVPAPIPNNAAFLGMALGVQWATSCGTSVLGTSISNCISFVVTDS